MSTDNIYFCEEHSSISMSIFIPLYLEPFKPWHISHYANENVGNSDNNKQIKLMHAVKMLQELINKLKSTKKTIK